MKETIETIVEAGYDIKIRKVDEKWIIVLTTIEILKPKIEIFEDTKFDTAFNKAFYHVKPNYPRG